jgi:carbamoyltransferase
VGTRILGLSTYYHDGASALVVDGRIVAAAQEERFTRRKQDAGFPCYEPAKLDRFWLEFSA